MARVPRQYIRKRVGTPRRFCGESAARIVASTTHPPESPAARRSRTPRAMPRGKKHIQSAYAANTPRLPTRQVPRRERANSRRASCAQLGGRLEHQPRERLDRAGVARVERERRAQLAQGELAHLGHRGREAGGLHRRLGVLLGHLPALLHVAVPVEEALHGVVDLARGGVAVLRVERGGPDADGDELGRHALLHGALGEVVVELAERRVVDGVEALPSGGAARASRARRAGRRGCRRRCGRRAGRSRRGAARATCTPASPSPRRPGCRAGCSGRRDAARRPPTP